MNLLKGETAGYYLGKPYFLNGFNVYRKDKYIQEMHPHGLMSCLECYSYAIPHDLRIKDRRGFHQTLMN